MHRAAPEDTQAKIYKLLNIKSINVRNAIDIQIFLDSNGDKWTERILQEKGSGRSTRSIRNNPFLAMLVKEVFAIATENKTAILVGYLLQLAIYAHYRIGIL